MKDTITEKNLKNLIGKIIKWEAPGYSSNGKYRGVAKIISVDLSQRNPIKSETISGNQLQFAFINKSENGKCICFSDSDRYIDFEEIDEENPFYNLHLKYGWGFKKDFAKAPYSIDEKTKKENSQFDFEKVEKRVSSDTTICYFKVTLK